MFIICFMVRSSRLPFRKKRAVLEDKKARHRMGHTKKKITRVRVDSGQDIRSPHRHLIRIARQIEDPTPLDCE